MGKVTVIQTCEIFICKGCTGVRYRTLLPCNMYSKLSQKQIVQKVENFLRNESAYLVAYKFCTMDYKKYFLKRDFLEVVPNDCEDVSDWNISYLFDKYDFKTIDRRADPAILIMGDDNSMKYRINYYLDLISQGYSNEEALSMIYS